jgi:hypothetical protein
MIATAPLMQVAGSYQAVIVSIEPGYCDNARSLFVDRFDVT